MADPTLVQVLNACDELCKQFGGLLLLQARVSDDKVKKFSTVSIFHYHEQFFVRLDDLSVTRANVSRH